MEECEYWHYHSNEEFKKKFDVQELQDNGQLVAKTFDNEDEMSGYLDALSDVDKLYGRTFWYDLQEQDYNELTSKP